MILIADSPSLPGCWNWPIASSPRSVTGSRRRCPRCAPDFDPSDPRISSQELAAFLATQYPDAGWSRTEHYGWISGLLLELGITSLDELGGLLASVDMDALITRMGYQYPAGAVRRLDDALLAVFGERYVGLTANAHRVELLTSRLNKLSGRSATT